MQNSEIKRWETLVRQGRDPLTHWDPEKDREFYVYNYTLLHPVNLKQHHPSWTKLTIVVKGIFKGIFKVHHSMGILKDRNAAF